MTAINPGRLGVTPLLIEAVPMGLLVPHVYAALRQLSVGNNPALHQHLQISVLRGAATNDDPPPIHISLSDTLHATTENRADALSAGFACLAHWLRGQGLISGWRNERFSVRKPDGSVWFALERACFRPLGLVSEAVHTHAWCSNGDTWLGRRAAHKATDPGKLDNLAAGGLTHGESPADCMVRELWEEAGVPAEIAQHIQPISIPLLSERLEPEGMHREWLHCYTLNVPGDFTPVNRDGEVSEFIRCTPAQLQAWTASGALTADAALCADLALRCRRTL